MALFSAGVRQLIEEIKEYLDEEDYEAASELADQIPVHKIKTASEFNLLGRAYKNNGQYEKAQNMFEQSYEIRASRVTLLDLMDCCLENGETEEAEQYFDEYHRAAPEDKGTLYAYRYRIEKKKGSEKPLLIKILEELKAVEYKEEYAYELAKLYHKAGMAQNCMAECRDIILWFGTGVIVERAKALLAYYKGEISLEEIKAAGERYLASQEKQTEEQKTEPQLQPVEAVYEEASEAEEEPEDSYEEELPEIDFTGLGFDEAVSEIPEEELFVPVYEEKVVESAKLSKLLKTKKVSLFEEMKNFERVDQVHKQMVKSLELVLADRENAYFVITGEEKAGKTTFAYSFIRLLYRLGIVKYDRTATISAIRLNQISLRDYQKELSGCNLIIENAGGMTQETVEEVLSFFWGCKGSSCVILEDSSRNINKFLRSREDLNALFNNRIHLGKYNADDLLGFAYEYIKKEDYGIHKTAAEVLRNKIDEIVRNYGDDERLIKIYDLAADVVARANRRNGGVLLGMAMEGKFREGNYFVILPEDVEN